MIHGKKILIFGGSGSLGKALIDRYIDHNEVYVYSRDECKQWEIRLSNPSPGLHFVIGDVRDPIKIKKTLSRIRPHVLIMAAAMKHIDRCEYETTECIATNLMGTVNILHVIEEDQMDLESVCFVSTDKACSPVNIYGMCKAASECCIVETSLHVPSVKFVVVRYGNVLNSRGSIIPILHQVGQDTNKTRFSLTDTRMTRFIMTLEQSVDLIEHALLHAPSGTIVIPKLVSMKLVDLISIFSDIYQKPWELSQLRPGEKTLESLINETQSRRLTLSHDRDYYYILPYHQHTEAPTAQEIRDYNSLLNPISREELRDLLMGLELIPSTGPPGQPR